MSSSQWPAHKGRHPGNTKKMVLSDSEDDFGDFMPNRRSRSICGCLFKTLKYIFLSWPFQLLYMTMICLFAHKCLIMVTGWGLWDWGKHIWFNGLILLHYAYYQLVEIGKEARQYNVPNLHGSAVPTSQEQYHELSLRKEIDGQCKALRSDIGAVLEAMVEKYNEWGEKQTTKTSVDIK